MFVNFNWAKIGKFMIGAGYVLSKTSDETDGALSLPADNFDLRGERGASQQDTRHRFNILTNFRLTKSLSLSSIFNASSARPYNITTGLTTIKTCPSTTARRASDATAREARDSGILARV